MLSQGEVLQPERGRRFNSVERAASIIVETALTPTHGRAEEAAALLMVEPLRSARRITLGGDKGYDDGK